MSKVIHLFAPLRKQPNRPKASPLMKVGDIDYTLILTDQASNLLFMHFSESGGYHEVSRYCDPFGIAQIRADPTLLDDAYQGAPTFATSFNADLTLIDGPIAVSALRLVVGAPAARQLYNRAVSRKSIHPALADYVVKWGAHFRECGGFEILRVCYCLDPKDCNQVKLEHQTHGLSGSLLKAQGQRKLRFRDFVHSR